MTNRLADRDERTTSVENTSYRWAYYILSYGLLASVAYRGFIRDEASWDLLALVILGGVVSAGYQQAYRVLSGRWVLFSVLAAATAVVLAVAIVLFMR